MFGFLCSRLYFEQGRYNEMEVLHVRALQIREQMLGPDHPDIATSLNHLGNLYLTKHIYVEAEPLLKRLRWPV